MPSACHHLLHHDGTVPTKASTVYAGPITVSANQTIKAIAIPQNYAASAVASAAYVIAAAAPTLPPQAGKYTSAPVRHDQRCRQRCHHLLHHRWHGATKASTV